MELNIKAVLNNLTRQQIGQTYNNILGETFNPHNRLLSAGGSSGGEAALMALRGSTVGLGTDIGRGRTGHRPKYMCC
jgi:hypothetical protein